MQEAGRFLESTLPPSLEDLTPGQEVALGLSWRGFGLYAGIFHLLRAELPHEAQVLLRSLLEETIRLEYFRRNSADLESLTLRFLKGCLIEEQGLQAAAKSCFPAAGAPPIAADTELRTLIADGKRLGYQMSPQLPGVSAMAKTIGHPELYYLYKLFSMAVHPSRLAMGGKFERRDDGAFWMGAIPDIKTAVRVGHGSTNAAISLMASTAALLGTSDGSEFASTVRAEQWQILMADVGITSPKTDSVG